MMMEQAMLKVRSPYTRRAQSVETIASAHSAPAVWNTRMVQFVSVTPRTDKAADVITSALSVGTETMTQVMEKVRPPKTRRAQSVRTIAGA